MLLQQQRIDSSKHILLLPLEKEKSGWLVGVSHFGVNYAEGLGGDGF
jgi:hypothetical protein